MKIAKYILVASAFFGCNDKQAMYIDLESQCNNGIYSVRYFNLSTGDASMNYYSGKTECDYDENGRVISEKYYDSINFDGKLTVETTYYWQEYSVMIEVKDYVYGSYENNFLSSRRVIDMM